jgi:hypothetical protein
MNIVNMTTRVLVVVVALSLWAAPALAEWGPPEIAVQGLLTNLADEAVEGPVDLTFSVYQGVGGQVAEWTETHVGVPLAFGHFDLVLGTVNPMDAPPVFEEFDNLWVGISVDGGPELPRAKLAAVGYAMQARHAEYCGSLTGSVCDQNQILKWSGEEWVCAADENTGYDAGWAISLADGKITAVKNVLDGAYVEEDEEDAISNEMIQGGAVSDGKITDVAWAKLTGVPEGFADGVDNGLLVELDPRVGLLNQNKWCTTDGLAVNCVADQPVMAEDDPQVGQNQTNRVPYWDGTALIAGSIFDNGDVGIGTGNVNPAGKLHVAGGLVRIGIAGGNNFANGAGDLYVQDALEVDGSSYVAGTASSGTLANTGDFSNNGDIINYGTFTTAGEATFNGELDVNGVADFAKAVDFNADVSMNSKAITDLATPAAASDAVNKDYVDKIVASQVSPVASRSKQRYTVVLNVKSTGYCPQGYTKETVESLRGPDKNLYISINSQGLFMGGMNSQGQGQEYIHVRLNSNNAPANICSRTFTSTSGKPHISVFMPAGGNANSCPATYNHMPASTLKGNNANAYFQATEAGAYFGYVDSWGTTSHNYEDNSGYLTRNFTTQVGTICFKVMGVDEDTDSSTGVFPVILGVKNDTDCPNGWTVKTSSETDSSNGYTYIQYSGNASVIGGQGGWGHGGGNYMQIHFHYSHVNFVCWNHYVRDGQPFYNIRTPHTGSCPNGYMSFNASSLKATDNNGRLAATGEGLYMGGIHSWGMHDHSEGYIQHSFTSQVNNKVCLKMDGVK